MNEKTLDYQPVQPKKKLGLGFVLAMFIILFPTLLFFVGFLWFGRHF
jgi:hypothetical protein